MKRLCPAARGAALGAAALGVTLAALPAAAQHPNMAQGFRPEHTFEVGGIENVNLFNGSLNLVIPIGGSFPVGPDFSVGFTLTYAGSPWEWELGPDPDASEHEYLQALPRRTANAGVGWELGFGRLLAPRDPGNPSDKTQYQSPDQALHELAGALHSDEGSVPPIPRTAPICASRTLPKPWSTRAGPARFSGSTARPGSRTPRATASRSSTSISPSPASPSSGA